MKYSNTIIIKIIFKNIYISLCMYFFLNPNIHMYWGTPVHLFLKHVKKKKKNATMYFHIFWKSNSMVLLKSDAHTVSASTPVGYLGYNICDLVVFRRACVPQFRILATAYVSIKNRAIYFCTVLPFESTWQSIVTCQTLQEWIQI